MSTSTANHMLPFLTLSLPLHHSIDGFDNGLYGINDYEAGHMDPQQCQLLQCTTMALQDAGIPTKDIAGTNTSVFVGEMLWEFLLL